MNIQTTNTPPARTTIQVTTGGPPRIQPGGLFEHEGRIWRVRQVSGSEVTAEWVPNVEVNRAELASLGPLTGSPD